MAKPAKLDEIMAALEERIALLRAIRLSVAVAFTGQLEEEEEATVEPEQVPQQRKPRAKRKTAKIVRGVAGHVLITEILQGGGPLTALDVLKLLKQKGWHTSSRDPKGLVTVTLSSMVRKGVLQKGAEGYSLAVPVPSQEPVLETPEAAVVQ